MGRGKGEESETRRFSRGTHRNLNHRDCFSFRPCLVRVCVNRFVSAGAQLNPSRLLSQNVCKAPPEERRALRFLEPNEKNQRRWHERKKIVFAFFRGALFKK